MRYLSKLILLLFISLIIGYIMYPNIDYPPAPAGSVMSSEPADTEDTNRRSFFVNLDREGVISHYKNQFDYLPILRLNYPPEDAQTIIRDQTRSAYLEELVHPFRESVYINGFTPSTPKDDIWYKGVHYEQKITVKYAQSNRYVRLLLVSVSILILYWLLCEIRLDFKNVGKR